MICRYAQPAGWYRNSDVRKFPLEIPHIPGTPIFPLEIPHIPHIPIGNSPLENLDGAFPQKATATRSTRWPWNFHGGALEVGRGHRAETAAVALVSLQTGAPKSGAGPGELGGNSWKWMEDDVGWCGMMWDEIWRQKWCQSCCTGCRMTLRSGSLDGGNILAAPLKSAWSHGELWSSRKTPWKSSWWRRASSAGGVKWNSSLEWSWIYPSNLAVMSWF